MSLAPLPPLPDGGGDTGDVRVEDLTPGQLFDLIAAGPDLEGEGPLAGVDQLVAINRLTS